MNTYHVSIPTTVVYCVEAKDEDDARGRVAWAVSGKPLDPDACWPVDALTEMEPPKRWDVKELRGCYTCGETIGDARCNCNG